MSVANVDTSLGRARCRVQSESEPVVRSQMLTMRCAPGAKPLVESSSIVFVPKAP